LFWFGYRQAEISKEKLLCLSHPSQPSCRPDSGARQMNVSSPIPNKGGDRLDVLWEDGEGVFCCKRRLNTDGKRENVLIVTLTAEHPTPARSRAADRVCAKAVSRRAQPSFAP
jgi:hypothetical protein